MPRSAIFTFTDPLPFQAALRAAEVEVCVTAKGEFRAELTQINLHRLWMQHSRESLPRVYHAALTPKRAVFMFLSHADQAEVHHSGMDVRPGDLVADAPGSTHHFRTNGRCDWGAMSLGLEDLSAASYALVGRELTAPSVTERIRPDPTLMRRLVQLHAAARQLATAAPDTLEHPEVSGALEDALVRTLATILSGSAPDETGSRWRHHAAIIRRFEELLAANCDRPMYLAEICAATGASERTLRVCCEEHLGMGPVRYLWLRRMHLARRALILADPAKTTVTQVATDHGFWELGRFSVGYRGLFGESPSATLRRPADDRPRSQNRPTTFADAESA